jgi:hypothetical protein
LNKRLTRFDFLFPLAFIFMLVCAIGTFFYGLQLGTDRTTAKFEKMMEQKTEKAKGLPAYDQSYLVSFYHTVFSPFREFETKWFQAMNDIELGGSSIDPASLLKELSKLADEKYNTALPQTLPDTSELLIQAQQNYLKSLKLFNHAADRLISGANSKNGASLLADIEANAEYKEAKAFALQAQNQYFDAIVKWNEQDNPRLQGLDKLADKQLSTADWSKLNLNLKNKYTTSLLAESLAFNNFNPQDLVIHVDEMIKTGQAQRMNAATVRQLVDVLVGTGAVRAGDFIAGKAKWYGNETLPQLPFFYKSN